MTDELGTDPLPGRMKRIAALVPWQPETCPGQRTRIEFWAGHLPQFGWTVDFYPFQDERLEALLYQRGSPLAKAWSLLRCYRKQLRRVRQLPECDVIFVYRELAQIGPALLERLAKRHGVPLVYDLDEPTFVRYRSPTNGWASLLKFPGKTTTLLRIADQVIAVNELIADYAARFNRSVTVVPMFVDVERYRPGEQPVTGPVRLVWSGSRSTMNNLRSIAPALRRLQADRDVAIRIIGEGSVDLPGVSLELRQFAVEREVSDLQDCHIGLVPLPDVPWNHWKFFFKVVQYMSVGVPVVAQRMGSNAAMIDDGVNGFLVETQDEWYDRVRTLVDNPGLRRRMGMAARTTAVERFSSEVHLKRVASVFDAAVGTRASLAEQSSAVVAPPIDGLGQA